MVSRGVGIRSQAAVRQPSLLQRSLNPKLSKLGTHGKKNIIFKSAKRVAWRGNRKLWFGCLFSVALQTIPQKDSISPLSGWSDLHPEGWWGMAEIPECYVTKEALHPLRRSTFCPQLPWEGHTGHTAAPHGSDHTHGTDACVLSKDSNQLTALW